MTRLAAETGLAFTIDESALTEAFADWLKAFNAQKPRASEDKRDYVGFAAGLMVQTLIEKAPATAGAAPDRADPSKPVYFWPEGYLYLSYCLNVRGLVIEQDFKGGPSSGERLDDIRSWWSFKENVQEDPALAIAFLEWFAGDEPDWSMPSLFRPTRIRQLSEERKVKIVRQPSA